MAMAQMNRLVRRLKRVALIDERACLSDGDLLTRFVVHKDSDAFEALVRKHGPVVLAVCRQVLGNVHDAEDAFQATFLVLLHKANSLANPELVGSWLYGAAYFIAKNAQVSTRRRRTHEERARRMAPLATTESTMTAAELQPLLEELARLPERFRTPLALCELQGKSRAQAAKLLGCRAGTLSSRLARGRALLRTRLAKRGFQLSIGVLAMATTRQTLRASLSPTLTATTMRTIAACMAGDVALAAKTAGQALAIAKAVLNGLAGSKLHSWVMCLAGLLALSGTAVLVHGSLISAPAEATAPAEQKETVYLQERPRLDIHEDPLPAGAIARLGTVRWRPGNEVTALAFSPDGTKLASGPIYTNTIQIWNRADGRQLLECRGHRGTIMQADFARDGNRLVSSSLDKTVRIWDVATGKELRQWPSPWPCKFALAPDGRMLALANEDRAVHLWDTASGRELRALKVGIEASIRSGFEPIPLAFSDDGKKLISADRESLRLWDVETGRLECSVANGSRGEALAAAFHGGTVSVLSGMYGAPYTLWTVTPGDVPRTLRVEPGQQAQCVFAPAGDSLLFSSPGQGVRQWDAISGMELRRFSGMRGDARALAFSSDGRTAAAGTSGSALHLWDAATGKEQQTFGTPTSAVDSVALARTGAVAATASVDGVLQMWDRVTGKQLWRYRGDPAKAPTSAAITPDGRMVLAGGIGKGIRLLDSATGKQLGQLLTSDFAGVLGASNDGRTVLTIQNGRNVVWWDLQAGQERSRYPEAGKLVWEIEYARWSLANQRFHPPCSACSPNGRLAAIGDQCKLLCIRESAPGKVQTLFEAELNSISCLAFSADAAQLATAGDEPFVLIWDVGTGKSRRQLDARGHEVAALAYSPDGKLLAAGTSRGSILLWDLATGKQMARRTGHPSAIHQLSFTADSKLLASAGGTDMTALIWDVAEMQK
jgi:RNA polymerase sigma factor (sigma-70 family)